MDLPLDVQLSIRLLFAAALGAVIGAEREIHDHPAGVRTHLLVAFGCALFTVLSIYGFTDPVRGTSNADPSRLAAQILTGIGFIGAGAIVKYGTSIRGLTTAASLWATAAIGIAAGTGLFVLALVGTVIIGFSLWPLNVVARYVNRRSAATVRLRVMLVRLDSLAEISDLLKAKKVRLDGVKTQHRAADQYELHLVLRVPAAVPPDSIVAMISAVPDVTILETDRQAD